MLSTPLRTASHQLGYSRNSIPWDEYTYCIRYNGTVFHGVDAPCKWCCQECALTQHRCTACNDVAWDHSGYCRECLADPLRLSYMSRHAK